MIDKKTMVPCVDWFRGIVDIDDVSRFCDLLESVDCRLKFDNFVSDGRSMLNFGRRYCHVEVPSLTFAFNPIDPFDPECLIADPYANNKHILFSLSGDAIRYLGSDTLLGIFRLLFKIGCKCTRIDFALDFFDPQNKIVPLMQEGLENFIAPQKGVIVASSKMKRDPVNWKCYINRYPDGSRTVGYDLGNHGSNHGMLRLYDKRYETLYGRHRNRSEAMLKGREYWYRAELELHNGRENLWADDAFTLFCCNNFNLYAIFGRTLSEFVSFCYVKFVSDGSFSVVDEWDEFIQSLVGVIHFVELVREKFIPKDLEYHWSMAKHYSSMLSAFLDLARTDRRRFNALISEGREKRLQSPDKQIRYYAINEIVDYFSN